MCHGPTQIKDKKLDSEGLIGLTLRCRGTKKWTSTSTASKCDNLKLMKCKDGSRICGLQTRTLQDQGHVGDNMGVMDVKLFCCPPVKSKFSALYALYRSF